MRRAYPYEAAYERVLGTSFDLKVVGASPEIGPRAEAAALGEVDRLEPIFNRFRPDSEMRRFDASEEETPISDELAYLLAESESWRVRTANAFHPAIEAFDTPYADLALLLPELDRPQWTLSGGQARKTGRFPTNLNAIAKGYIVDRAAEAALDAGGDEVLINVGGDLRHRGRRPIVASVSDPFQPAENRPPIAQIRLREEGMATSGNYHRGAWKDGKWISHILDPRTGRPVESIVSASVVAESAMVADVLATVFSVMRPDESILLADSLPGVACLLISQDGHVTTNLAWQRRSVTR